MARAIKWILVLCLIAGFACLWVYKDYQRFLHTPINLGSSERIVQIPAGASARKVAEILDKEGIIDRKWMMVFVMRQSGLADRLQPDTVILTEDMTPAVLPEVFARVGKYSRRTVQILVGMNLWQIAERMQTQRIADAKSFMAAAKSPILAAEAGIPASSFEGYLAPGAYTFEPGTPVEAVIDEMHGRWIEQWQKIVNDNRGAYETALRRQLTDHDLVTLASMVEKEAVAEREKPVIARVFFNRLRKKMKLQSDPTCVYPPKFIGEKPTPARCRDAKSRYSTYVIPALPPGPIASPSSSSLRAVILPYSGPDDTQLLYFVAKNDGSMTHYFSTTYREHETAVNYFLKGKKSVKPRGTQQPK